MGDPAWSGAAAESFRALRAGSWRAGILRELAAVIADVGLGLCTEGV
jgi:hypothetical protein